MIYHRIITNIRTKHGLTQEKFADALGYETDYITALEDNYVQATFEFVTRLINKFDLHDSAITEDAHATLMDNLNIFKHRIDSGELKEAAEMMPELEKKANLSYSPAVENYFGLFAAYYYITVGNKKALGEKMSALKKQTSKFNARHRYYYNHLIGMREFNAQRYKEALNAFLKAEKLDEHLEWNDVRFSYGYGLCLSAMGYISRAVEYFRKARHMSSWVKGYDGKSNSWYEVDIDCSLANSLSRTGRIDEALHILRNRLKLEKKKDNEKARLSPVYLNIGIAYLYAKRYSDAIKNFDTAYQYPNQYNAHKTMLYHKALALIESGNINKGLICIREGLKVSTEDIWNVLLEALECSVTLSDSESLKNMKTIAIPKLMKYYQYAEAAKYHKELSNFYIKMDDKDMALSHSFEAINVYEQLYEERVKGGL